MDVGVSILNKKVEAGTASCGDGLPAGSSKALAARLLAVVTARGAETGKKADGRDLCSRAACRAVLVNGVPGRRGTGKHPLQYTSAF